MLPAKSALALKSFERLNDQSTCKRRQTNEKNHHQDHRRGVSDFGLGLNKCLGGQRASTTMLSQTLRVEVSCSQ
jgi:hypothetical protein